MKYTPEIEVGGYDPRKPYLNTGYYFIRVSDDNDKKLMEISTPFNRVDTHKIAEALTSDNRLLVTPKGKDYMLVKNMLQMVPQPSDNPQFETGYDLFMYISDIVGFDNITQAKCGLVTFDTKLDIWNPTHKS